MAKRKNWTSQVQFYFIIRKTVSLENWLAKMRADHNMRNWNGEILLIFLMKVWPIVKELENSAAKGNNQYYLGGIISYIQISKNHNLEKHKLNNFLIFKISLEINGPQLLDNYLAEQTIKLKTFSILHWGEL